MSTFSIFKPQIEQDIKKIAKKVKDILSDSCSLLHSKCTDKSYHECIGVSEKYCMKDFPQPDGCAFKGGYFPYKSSIRYPNFVNIQHLSNNQKLVVCSTTQIDPLFRSMKQKYLNKIQRVYIGLESGLFRAYPGALQESKNGICDKSYDPRKRPWYVGATTGSKNVIIAIDISSHMKKQYLKQIKTAVAGLIQTLGLNDFLAIVLFSSSSKVLFYTSLKRATFQIQQALISSVNKLTHVDDDATNYQQAFLKIQDIYNAPVIDSNNKFCQSSTNITFFITASPSLKNQSQINKIINSTKVLKKSLIYTYGFGQKVDLNIMKSISCQHNGSMFNVSNQNLTYAIRYYEKHLATAINVDSPVWSPPYNDANTYQKMTTVSIPIYKYQFEYRRIVGAVGIDVSMTVLQYQNYSMSYVINELMQCTPTQPILFNQCLTQNYRIGQSKCNIQNCPTGTSTPLASTCQFIVNQTLLQKNHDNSTFGQNPMCCGLKASQLTGIIIGLSIFSLIIIIILLILIYRYCFNKVIISRISGQTQTIMQSSELQSIKNKKNKIAQEKKKQQYPNLDSAQNLNGEQSHKIQQTQNKLKSIQKNPYTEKQKAAQHKITSEPNKIREQFSHSKNKRKIYTLDVENNTAKQISQNETI